MEKHALNEMERPANTLAVTVQPLLPLPVLHQPLCEARHSERSDSMKPVILSEAFDSLIVKRAVEEPPYLRGERSDPSAFAACSSNHQQASSRPKQRTASSSLRNGETCPERLERPANTLAVTRTYLRRSTFKDTGTCSTISIPKPCSAGTCVSVFVSS